MSHLEFDWRSPVWRPFLEGLAARHTIIRYDERGSGLSDWNAPDLSFESWVRDLESVVDVIGLKRFALLGISRGGPIAIAYAVRHPERVSHLVLYGAFAMGRNHYAPATNMEARRAIISLVRLNWGAKNPAFGRLFTCRFIPNATPEHEQWFDDLQRISTSAEHAARLMEIDDAIDVRELLPKVTVPTLVLHCDEDKVTSPRHGQQLAAAIPGAQYVSLHSANHLPLAEEPAWQEVLAALAQFLGW